MKGASIGLGAVAMAADLGRQHGLVIETDSSAAKGISSRRGVGKVRHLHTPLLWIQQKVADGSLVVRKVKGTEHPPDLGTKHLGRALMEKHLKACNFEFREDKSKFGLRMA